MKPLATTEIASIERHRSIWSDLVPIAIAVSIFSMLSIWGAVASDGFLEADSLTHYLYARFAMVETHYLVNIWGRPLVTGLYCIPAYFFGRMGVRVTSLGLALICAFVAYAIARWCDREGEARAEPGSHPDPLPDYHERGKDRLGGSLVFPNTSRIPLLALIFTLAQPLVFLHSFSELTELPFAALLGMAFVAYLYREYLAMTVLIALSPLARPEGFGFLFLACVALIVHRRWWWIPVLAVPLLAWDYFGWLRYGSPDYHSNLPHALAWLPWLKHEWPYAEESLYKPGSIFHFVMLMPAVMSPFIFPGLCVGVWRITRNRATILIAAIPLMILVGHSILYATGKMASSGEMRYMLIVAPFWGVLAAKGWTWIFARLSWRHPLRWAALAAIAPALINQRLQVGPVVLGYEVLPLHLNQDMKIARRVSRWYQNWPMRDEYPRVLAAHPGVYYFLDISPTQKLQTREWTKQTIADAPRGTILIWDPIYGVYNSDAKRSVTQEEIQNAGWIYDEQTSELINDENTEDTDRWSVWLSPESQSGAESKGEIP